MIINQGNLLNLYTGFKATFQGAFTAVKPLYGSVAMTVPSKTKAEEYGWLGQFPRIREWLGDRVVNSISVHDYRIKNKDWEFTVGVDRNDIEDDDVGLYTPMISEIGRSAATFPDELIWPLLAAGNSTLCYDGQYFFDTDHPVLNADGVPQSTSNWGAGSGTPWYLLDTSRAIKPLIFQNRKSFDFVRMDAATDEVVFNRKEYRYGVDGRCNVGYGFWQLAYGSKQTLDATNYDAARSAMGSLKGDYGRPLAIVPNLLVVPPSLEGAARRLLTNELVGNGESNAWKGTADILVVPWLA